MRVLFIGHRDTNLSDILLHIHTNSRPIITENVGNFYVAFTFSVNELCRVCRFGFELI